MNGKTQSDALLHGLTKSGGLVAHMLADGTAAQPRRLQAAVLGRAVELKFRTAPGRSPRTSSPTRRPGGCGPQNGRSPR